MNENPSFQPHRGVAILVLGILALTMSCFPLGIIAWVMGSSDLRAIDAGAMDPAGRGMAQAGRILGMISVAFIVLAVFALAVLAFFGVLTGLAQQH